jgi:hypothetical protein
MNESDLFKTVAFATAFACLGGFVVVERARSQLIETKRHPVELVQASPAALLYAHSFPLALFLSVFLKLPSDLHRVGALAVCWLPIPVSILKLPTPWTAPAAFGIRGSMIAIVAIATLLQQHSSSPFQDLSLISFSMAAWMSCGLASYCAWAAHPEYGSFTDTKQSFLSAMQVCFLCGFLFQYMAKVK